MTAPIADRDRAKLQALLRDLFQFDAADLDFGIYRILNLRREEIEQFIEEDLLDAVDEALDQLQEAAVADLEQELQEKRQAFIANFGADALDEAGEVVEVYQETPAARAYREARRALAAARTTLETRRLIFNDLYRFFSRYYDQGDFLTERRYSSREPKYAIPYNGEEVLLYWANRDQYYVKTSERHADYRFTAGDLTVWFRLESAQEPTNNVQSDTRYFVLSAEDRFDYDEATETLTVHFEYRPLTDTEDDRYLATYNASLPKSSRRKTLDRSVLVDAMETLLLEAIDRSEVRQALARAYRSTPESPSVLGYHLNRYTARNTMDYFVHKDLGGFLRRELDYFLKNEVLQIDDVVGDESAELARHTVARMRAIRHVAQRIISFLAQIEDFQKSLFEKKKFVVRTDYCVTLDRVPESLYPEILANKAQLAEWRSLYAISKWSNNLFRSGTIDEEFLQKHPGVMIDTAFFDDDFKMRLISCVDELDRSVDGVLLHAEAFQALNILGEKFAGQVKVIFIDPPYNIGSDDFLYKDGYQHSTWLSMICQSLRLTKELADPSAIIGSTIDDNEVSRLTPLMDDVFGEQQRLANAPWRSEPSGGKEKTGLRTGHEYLVIYHNGTISEITQEERSTGKLNLRDRWGPYRKGRELRKWGGTSLREDRPGQYYPLTAPDGTEVYPIRNDGKPGHWRWGVKNSKIKRALREPDFFHWEKTPFDRGVTYQGKSERWTPYVKIRDEKKSVGWSTWLDSFGFNADATRTLKSLFGFKNFDTPKPVQLIDWFVNLHSDEEGLVLDFFAGSGTSAQAVIEQNRDEAQRKYILVEMGEHFFSVLKPRIQKAVFASDWRDGVPQNPESGVSHMFKYQQIESYEDALNNIVVERPEDLQPELFPDEMQREYMLHYLLDVETRNSPTLASEGAFERPFDYQLLIQHGHASPRPTTVDLVETFHYLIGMHVRRLEQHWHQERRYMVSWGSVHTENGIEEVAVIWRDTEGLDLEAEAAWAEETLFARTPDRVYVNGKSFITKAEPLEYTFRNRMLEEAGRAQ